MKLPKKSRVIRNSILLGVLLIALGRWRSDRHPEAPTTGTLYLIAFALLALGVTLAVRARK